MGAWERRGKGDGSALEPKMIQEAGQNEKGCMANNTRTLSNVFSVPLDRERDGDAMGAHQATDAKKIKMFLVGRDTEQKCTQIYAKI